MTLTPEELDCDVDDDGVPNYPQDEDLITNDRITFYRFGFEHRGPCVVAKDRDWQDAVKEYMERTNYWPDVWLCEERGGYTNITLEGP